MIQEMIMMLLDDDDDVSEEECGIYLWEYWSTTRQIRCLFGQRVPMIVSFTCSFFHLLTFICTHPLIHSFLRSSLIGGDCLDFNALYPNCFVELPYTIGDGLCFNSPPYNTEECGMWL